MSLNVLGLELLQEREGVRGSNRWTQQVTGPRPEGQRGGILDVHTNTHTFPQTEADTQPTIRTHAELLMDDCWEAPGLTFALCSAGVV